MGFIDDIDGETFTSFDGTDHESLHSFAGLQEEPTSDEQIALYIQTRLLSFLKTESIEHLDQAIARMQGWVALTPADHSERIWRFQFLDKMLVLKNRLNTVSDK
ncbi:hypothetical protein F5Y12DRAFT_24930 [Xylaria sp. FL1777]|nr:hypothetical protein F5Y12DRAFT_24930 [Xylaria sp. FL1777]